MTFSSYSQEDLQLLNSGMAMASSASAWPAWPVALHLFAALPRKALEGDVVSYNALINAGKAWRWQEGLQILSTLPGGEEDDDF